jgi:hypothetical protein
MTKRILAVIIAVLLLCAIAGTMSAYDVTPNTAITHNGLQVQSPDSIATDYTMYYRVGGDCLADNATGDIKVTQEAYCLVTLTLTNKGERISKASHNNIAGVSTTSNVTSTLSNVINNVVTSVNDKPNKDKACKNKNSGKDGTPEECNAGKGQEKHNP